MKSQPDHPSEETEAIRSEINTTRHRMDETIDALGQRFKGRHLIDEALHLFRQQQENGNMTKFRNRLSESADTAYHSVVDTIKTHPVPAALFGAGVGWLIYERTHSAADTEKGIRRATDYRSERHYEHDFSPGPLSGEVIGRPGNAPDETTDVTEGGRSSVKEKASRAMETVQHKAAEVRDRVRETGAEAREGARRIYDKSRERVTATVEGHPLESGLVFLAAGLIASLLIPTPRRVAERLEPKARELGERVREKAQDLVERGSHVVESATEAAKQEAKAQGLTSDSGASDKSSGEEKDRTTGSIPAI